MKKALSFLFILSFVCTFTTACTNQIKQKPNMIQAKRRFADFIEPQEPKNPNAVDLSDGPKLKYNANFGPKSPEFDIKIIDPYNY